MSAIFPIYATIHGAKKSHSLSPRVIVSLVACVDGLILLCAGFTAYLFHPVWSPEHHPIYFSAIVINVWATVSAFYHADLYKIEAIIHPQKHYSKFVLLCAISFLVMVAFAFLLKISVWYSRTWAFSWFFSTVFSICLGRIFIQSILLTRVREGLLSRNIAIVGAGEQGARLAEILKKQKDSWIRIVGIFDDRSNRVPEQICGHPLSGDVNTLVSHARANRVDDILVALPWQAEKRLFQILEKLQVLPVDVRLSPDLVGLNFADHNYSHYCGIPTLNVFDRPLSGWDRVLKRIEDIILSILILILILPVIVAIAVLIKLDSPGPVFFRQRRYGFNNQMFECLKFRTMYVDQQDNDANKLTTRNDPRVTRIGRLLRRTSLDELPQFFNVLKGEMSIVGPRPHAKAAGIQYQKLVIQYGIRHKIKPGITGWAQLYARGEPDTEEEIRKRVQYDVDYTSNWSLMRDLKIIGNTILVIVTDGNAHCWSAEPRQIS